MMRRTMLLVLTAAMVMALLMVAMALPVFAGGGDDDEENDNESASGGGARNGQIVFRRYFNPDQTKGAIFTMNPDGSHVRQITHPPKGWLDNLPAWSSDGKRIAFERFKSDTGASRIMVVNPDTGDTRTVVPCTGRCVHASDPNFSPDGHSIAYSRTVASPNVQDPPVWKLYSAIFIVGLDGKNSHQVTTTPKRHKGQPVTFDTFTPAFSPNGKLLTFVRANYQKENERFAVFVQPLGSPEDAQRITPWKLNCLDHPEFSPDGKLVLFRCLPKGEEGPSNLYWVHPDGTSLHKLTHEEDADKQYLGSSFSGEGGWITAGRTGGYGDEGNADVFRLLIKDGEVVREVNLTKSAIWDSAPVWGSHQPAG